VKVANDNGTLSFSPANDGREANAMTGTLRALVNNMVTGVTKGFEAQAHFGWRWLQSASSG
jgi:large subunit ribosomal protein L6